MRLFVIGFWSDDLGLPKAISQLKEKQSHEIVYWLIPKQYAAIDRRQFPGTTFHAAEDAFWGKPPEGMGDLEFPPLGSDLIQEFYETEVAVLTMMNKRYERLSMEERKHLYYHLLQYWYGVVQKYNPEAILFTTIPHSVYDFILYSIAKKFNIKTLMFGQTIFSDRLVLLDDYEIGPRALKEAAEKNQYAKFSFNNLSQYIQDYCRNQQFINDENRIGQQETVPPYKEGTYLAMKIFLNDYSGIKLFFKKLKILFSGTKNLSLFKILFLSLKQRIGPNLKKEYKSVQLEADLAKKFIYAPLCYQPEQSTSPQGGVFVDQILMIEILSSALPKDWLIYVKEHPYQWLSRGPIFFASRYRGYYKKIARLKNVRLVPMETNTFELIFNAQAVATVTGTAALEGLLRLKPALIFGHIWFEHCPGVFRVKDVSSSRKALEEIARGFAPDKDKLIAFLGLFDQISVRGCIDSFWQDVMLLSAEENADNIFKALAKELS